MLLLVVAPTVAVGQTGSSADTGITLPELSAQIEETSGEVYVRFDTGAEWVEASERQTLSVGDRLRTVEASTAALKIPAIALISVQESTHFEISELNRFKEDRGVLVEREGVTVNEIGLDVNKGEVQNSLKRHEGVNTDYELKTPNAVAGVRGTTFECDISTRETECTVLEGNIAFANRFGTRREIELGALQRSRMSLNDTEPSSPEAVSDEEVEDLRKVRDQAEKTLGLQPVLSSLTVNDNDVQPTGQGVYKITLNPDEIDEVVLSGRATAQEQGVSVSNVDVRREGDQLDVEGLRNWSVTLPLPEDPEQQTLTATIKITDSQGNESRAYPVQITFASEQQQTGVVPANLKQGDFSADLLQLGDRRSAGFTFPVELSGEDFLQAQSLSDTRVRSRENLVLAGDFDADTSIAGVAYRFAGEEVWQQANGADQWQIPVPLRMFSSRPEITVEVIGWTEDGYVSDVAQFGPMRYDESRSVIPINYTAGEVDVRLEAIAGQSMTASDLPDSFTSQELGSQQLLVEGSAIADSPVEAVAYSLDGGQTWLRADGREDWTITLPTDQSREFSIKVLAWTEGNKMGSPLSLGPIFYEQIQSVLPTNYQTGDVSVSLKTVAGFSVSNIEMPYYLYRDDADQDGILLTGEASGAGSIEGVAVSLDGGETWKRAEGAGEWSFYLPVGSSRTYTPQVIAWTSDGIIGEPVTVGELEYVSSSYTTVLRNHFQEAWNDFSDKNDEQFLSGFAEDFEYLDSLTGRSLTLNGFDNFLNDFYSGVRNLTTFFDVTQVLAGESGGEVQFALEWRGKEDDANRPFVMFGEQSRFKYRRTNNGQFEVISFEDFPLILYLFNRQQLRIPDLDGVLIETLEIVNNDDADIIAELMTPDFNVNKIEIGGHVKSGGIQPLTDSTFSTVDNLPSLGSGYEPNALIEEGRIYAMNIRDNFDRPSTGLLRVRDLRSNYVEVQIISAQSPPGIQEDVYRTYRGINPYE